MMGELVTSARGIAVVRTADMTGTLPMTLLNPLALLSDSFTEDILSRNGFGDGTYPFFDLIFAEEGREPDERNGPEYRVNINLNQRFSTIYGAAAQIVNRSFPGIIERVREILRTAARLPRYRVPGTGYDGGYAAAARSRRHGGPAETIYPRAMLSTSNLAFLFPSRVGFPGGRQSAVVVHLEKQGSGGYARQMLSHADITRLTRLTQFRRIAGRGRADLRAGGRGFVSLRAEDIGAAYELLRVAGRPAGRLREDMELRNALDLLGRGVSADSLAARLVPGADAASARARGRVNEALWEMASGRLVYSRGNAAARERIREAVARIELAEDAGNRSRRQAHARIERITDRLTAAEQAAAGERALSGERIRQVVERVENAENAEASERVISRERLRQVVERLEAAESAENAERVISSERLRQVIERIEAVEAREAGEDAVSRERIRQVIERLENTDNERRRESIVTRERIRQVIERLETAAESGSRESSLTKTRIEEVIEQIGGEEAERTRRDYRDRQARAPKPWYAPFTLALSRAFSRELLRDRTGFVRGDTDSLEEVVTPVMRERYRTLTKSFSDELLARARRSGETGGSVFNLLFREERQGDTNAETNNVFNIFNRRPAEAGTRPGADAARAAGEYMAMAGGELRYASPVRPGDAPPYASASTEASGDELGALPPWARDFIRESVEKQGEASSAASARRDMASLADIASSAAMKYGEPGAHGEDTVVWTAPGVARTSAPTVLKPAGRSSEEKTSAPARISDAEIRRMADRVYGMIENRVVLERRRLGC
jgi:hypothetical protein